MHARAEIGRVQRNVSFPGIAQSNHSTENPKTDLPLCRERDADD